jgi:hypothetical protein
MEYELDQEESKPSVEPSILVKALSQMKKIDASLNRPL